MSVDAFATPPRVEPRCFDEEALFPVSGVGQPPASELSAAEAFEALESMGIKGKPLRRRSMGTGVIECPIKIDYPLIEGVEILYAYRDRRLCGPTPPMDRRIRGGGLIVRSEPRSHDEVLDVRLFLLLARLLVWCKQNGIICIAHGGMHNPKRDRRYDHARGMAADLFGFVTSDRPRELITLAHDWTTARSSTRPRSGPRARPGLYDPGSHLSRDERLKMVEQTESERRNMSGDEKLLRVIWSYLYRECVIPRHRDAPSGFTKGSIVTPSHNTGHHDHFHVGLPLEPMRLRGRTPWPPR